MKVISFRSLEDAYQNQLIVTISLFILFGLLLLLCLFTYYTNIPPLFSALIVLFHLYLMMTWLFFEPIFTWTFTLISILYFTLFPGFSIPTGISLLFLTVCLNWLTAVSQKKLDNQKKEVTEIIREAKEQEQRQGLITLEMLNLNEKIVGAVQFKQLSETLSGKINLEEIVSLIFTCCEKNIAKGDIIRLYLLEQDMKTLKLHGTKVTGAPGSFPDHDPINLHVLRTNTSVLVTDLYKDERFGYSNFPLCSMKSCICAPLITGNRLSGIIRMDSTNSDAYTLGDLKFVSNIANLAALAIENALLYDITRRLAVTDGLTGLYTHSYFKETLARLIEEKIPLSVMFIDIDNFKEINDIHGHAVGDRLLIHISEIIKSTIPDDGIPARYGGEEFGVILKNFDQAEVVAQAEQVRTAITKTPITIRRAPVVTTASIGIGQYPANGKTIQELLATVDRALYKAKRTGKNRVISAQ